MGVRDIGENRHQEAQAKAAELGDLDGLRWHFIGQLQGNKAKAVRRYAHAIHSIGSRVAGAATSAPARRSTCSRRSTCPASPAAGASGRPSSTAWWTRCSRAPDLRLRGLMTVAPLGAEPRAAFAALRALGERIRAAAPDATALSMGMSGDFREAIREGATHLRIGTAITGNRPVPG